MPYCILIGCFSWIAYFVHQTDDELNAIYTAFAEWEKVTCVQFQEVDENLNLGQEEHMQLQRDSGQVVILFKATQSG